MIELAVRSITIVQFYWPPEPQDVPPRASVCGFCGNDASYSGWLHYSETLAAWVCNNERGCVERYRVRREEAK